MCEWFSFAFSNETPERSPDMSLARPARAAALPLALMAAVALAAASLTAPARAADEVNVYSYRQPFLIDPIFAAFERETGIEVNVVFAPKGLVERLKQEGANSPADLIFTVDIGRLSDAKAAGVTQAIDDATLSANIPAQYRDPQGHWFGLTTRARVIYASRDRVAPGEIASYEALADPEWRGRICTRSGSHAYQIGLTAAMIAHHGQEGARAWLEGVKANLARKPQGNDRAQVKAISEGQCDLSLGNNYYYGKMLLDEEQRPWAEAVRIVFPDQGGIGTHVNISGMALTTAAPNRDNAVMLMRFLASDLAQQMYAEQNFEYPVNPDVPWSGLVRSWGTFAADDLPLERIAQNRAAAIRLVNEVDYDG